jgi:hypothetical protein
MRVRSRGIRVAVFVSVLAIYGLPIPLPVLAPAAEQEVARAQDASDLPQTGIVCRSAISRETIRPFGGIPHNFSASCFFGSTDSNLDVTSVDGVNLDWRVKTTSTTQPIQKIGVNFQDEEATVNSEGVFQALRTKTSFPGTVRNFV